MDSSEGSNGVNGHNQASTDPSSSTKGDTGLNTACTLIQSILDQVSTNDSPHISTFDDNNIPSTIPTSTNGSTIPNRGSNTIAASTLK